MSSNSEAYNQLVVTASHFHQAIIKCQITLLTPGAAKIVYTAAEYAYKLYHSKLTVIQDSDPDAYDEGWTLQSMSAGGSKNINLLASLAVRAER